MAAKKAKLAAMEMAKTASIAKMKKSFTAVRALGRFGFSVSSKRRLSQIIADMKHSIQANKITSEFIYLFSNFSLKPSYRHFNLVEEGKYDMELMKKTPVAPDGYIPNSVIRKILFSGYPSMTLNEKDLLQKQYPELEPDVASTSTSTKCSSISSETELLSKKDRKLFKGKSRFCCYF